MNRVILKFYVDGLYFAERYTDAIPQIGDLVRLKTMVLYEVISRVYVFNDDACNISWVAIDIKLYEEEME